MLRNVIIMTSSGIVLFSKEFVSAVGKPSLIGGIITAMLDFSEQKTGLPVAYIELKNVCLAVSCDATHKVSCALFCDVSDGAEFSQIVCKELLDCFVETYATQLEQKQQSNVDVYADFYVKIADVIRGAVRPVLDQFQLSQRGIQQALVISGDTIIHSTTDVDKLSVLANHQALLALGSETMASKNDVANAVELKGDTTTVSIQRIERASFVVVYRNNVPSCRAEIAKTALLLKQVLVTASNLQDRKS